MPVYPRQDLLAKLEAVAPALGKPTFIPMLAHAFFDGVNLTATNDILAIRVPFESPLAFAVPGKPLIDLLNATNLNKLDLRLDGEALTIQGGWDPRRKRCTLRVSLPCLPEASLHWTPPDLAPEDGHLLPVDAAVRQALKLASLAADPDASALELRGLTLIGDGEASTIYATDNVSMVAATLPHPLPDGLTLTLPIPFVTEALRASGDGEGGLLLGTDSVSFHRDGIEVFGSALPIRERRLDFPALIADNLPDADWIPLPPTWDLVLKRATAIGGPDAAVTLSIQDGVLALVTEGPGGAVTDELPVEAPDARPVRLGLALLRRAAAFPLPWFALSTGGFAQGGDGLLYLVSSQA